MKKYHWIILSIVAGCFSAHQDSSPEQVEIMAAQNAIIKLANPTWISVVDYVPDFLEYSSNEFDDCALLIDVVNLTSDSISVRVYREAIRTGTIYGYEKNGDVWNTTADGESTGDTTIQQNDSLRLVVTMLTCKRQDSLDSMVIHPIIRLHGKDTTIQSSIYF